MAPRKLLVPWYGSVVWDVPDPHYPCGKVKFPTKADAKLAIKRVRANMQHWRRKDGKPSPYKCKNCGLWHWGHKRRREDDRDNGGRAHPEADAR